MENNKHFELKHTVYSYLVDSSPLRDHMPLWRTKPYQVLAIYNVLLRLNLMKTATVTLWKITNILN